MSMWIANVLSLSLALSAPLPSLDPAAGTSRHFQELIQRATTHLEKGEFAKAAAVRNLMPSGSLIVQWDDSTVPAKSRPAFIRGRNAAVEAWRRYYPELKVSFAAKGQVKVTFVQNLPPEAGEKTPAGAVFLEDFDPQGPVIEAVIALKRSAASTPITEREVRNEFAYAMGRFFGLERQFASSSVMNRADGMYAMDTTLIPGVAAAAKKNVAISDLIGKYAKEKQKVKAVAPRYQSDVKALTQPKPSVIQGDIVSWTMSVTNTGSGVLNLRFVPDCSCFSVSAPATVAAGKTELVTIYSSTREFPGEFSKSIYLYTNDPEASVTRIPVNMQVTPRYELVGTSRNRIYVTEDSSFKSTFYFVPRGAPLDLTAARLVGIAGIAEVEPWTGELPGAPGKTEKGYKVVVLASTELQPGRYGATLVLESKEKGWEQIQYGFEVQRGIASFPSSAYLGIIPKKTPARVTVTITKPGHMFSLTGASCDVPNVRVVYTKGKPMEEHQVTIEFDGMDTSGLIDGTLRLQTNDPKQPEIFIPVTGSIT